MVYIGHIILLAACVTFAFVFVWTAVVGIKRQKIYYEPSCTPIPLRERPLAFVGLCGFYIVLASAFAWGGFRIASDLATR
jgi:hypothetical protein